MAQKEPTKPIKDSEPKDSIPFRGCIGSCIDMGVERDIKSHRFDEPESPGRKRSHRTTVSFFPLPSSLRPQTSDISLQPSYIRHQPSYIRCYSPIPVALKESLPVPISLYCSAVNELMCNIPATSILSLPKRSLVPIRYAVFSSMGL